MVHISEFPEMQSHQNNKHFSPAPLTTTVVFFLNYTILALNSQAVGQQAAFYFTST